MNEELSYLEEALSTAEAMQRLLNNDDFKKIFVDGFFKEDMVQLGFNFTNVPSERRAHLVEALLARGILKQYIDGIITSGISAKNELDMMKEEN